jgi:dTDP-4-amino-4,6-dideoxygalactose transaminase
LYLLLVALRQFSNRKNVIVPAYTCPTVVQAVLKAGLKVTLCDINPDTLGLERKMLSHLIDDSILAIIAVHPFGFPEEMNDLMALGKREGIFIIEDAAQSLGARLEDRIIGSWGDAGIFSLGRGKVMTTGGGGIIVTANQEIAAGIEIAISKEMDIAPRTGLRTLAFLAGYILAVHPLGWWLIVRTPLNPALDSGEPESNYPVENLSTCQAGAGTSILSHVDEVNRIRRHNSENWQKVLSDFPFIRFPKPIPKAYAIYLRLPLLLETPELREQVLMMFHANGIGVSMMYTRPLAAIFSNQINLKGQNYSGAAYIVDRLVTLPTHHLLVHNDLEKAVQILNRV